MPPYLHAITLVSSPALLRAEAPATASVGDAVAVGAVALGTVLANMPGAKVSPRAGDLAKFSAFDARGKQRRG